MSRVLNCLLDLIKVGLPPSLLARIRVYRGRADIRRAEARLRDEARREWRHLLQNWVEQKRLVVPFDTPLTSRQRSLVFPPDPRTIVGSRGDDAMISAVLEAIRAGSHETQVDMICEGQGVSVAEKMGVRPVLLGADREFPATVTKLLAGGEYGTFFGLGADIIDGSYGPRIPALMLIAADLAARSGSRAAILGCSFGKEPAPQLTPVFRQLDPRVKLNIRDPLSLQRMQTFAPVSAGLVADLAFTLRPGQPDDRAANWIEAQRSAGCCVIGVNVHTILVRNPDAAWIESMTASLARAICGVATRRKVSWLLLPHDYRENLGDVDCLRRISGALQQHPDVQFLLLEGQHSAADLKALVGCLDGVVTGRMHLAIAALGMGVPALGLTYADKFEGLFSHFDLPASLLLKPSIFNDPVELARRIDAFVEALPALAGVIARRQDAVMALARSNFPLTRED